MQPEPSASISSPRVRRWAAGRIAAVVWLAGAPGAAPAQGWSHTEGAPGGGRYSPLAEIDRTNVAALEPVWTYRHGDVKSGGWGPARELRGSAFEGTPLVLGRTLVFTTPFSRVIALDAATGAERWTFDPQIETRGLFANMLINRGVAHWRGGEGEAPGACAERVLLATLDARLFALDLATGRPCADFGTGGVVDLTVGIEPLVDPREYNMTSPPTVVGDVVVVGSSIADTLRRRAPPGDVRGFDVRTGALRWTFQTIPRPGEPGAETWERGSHAASGAANVWTTMTADLERGWVFLPVSTPSPDYYGGDRPGANLFSDSLVVLDARTGERVWHFQTVHHDLWDYDLAAPPVLVTLRHGEAPRDAVALPTKQGYVFVLDRETGEPIWPIEERPAPGSPLADERPWPTQPHPTKPPHLTRPRLTVDDLDDSTPRRARACRKRWDELRYEGLFTPPGLDEALVYPYSAGGANWSGATWDPERQQLVVPVNDLAHVVRLRALPASNVEREDARPLRSLLRGLVFLWRGRNTGLRYQLPPAGGRTIFAVDGRPCTKPPWGRLVAVDLARGEIAWRAPTGRDGDDVGLHGFGPALATAGGLVFHGGTRDPVLRAHDADTGAVLARFALPAGLHAGPITYRLSADEPQLLVVAPGGHVGLGSELGDHVIAFGLSEEGGRGRAVGHNATPGVESASTLNPSPGSVDRSATPR